MKKNYRAIITQKELKEFKKRLICMGNYKTVALNSGFYIEKISRDYGIIGKFDDENDFEIMVFEDTSIDDLKRICKKRKISWFNNLII